MQLNPSEISELIKSRIQNMDAGAQMRTQGTVVSVTDGIVRSRGSEIRAEGMYSLGYPRGDGAEEINARFRVNNRDLASLRHAFKLVSGSSKMTHAINEKALGARNTEGFDNDTTNTRNSATDKRCSKAFANRLVHRLGAFK